MLVLFSLPFPMFVFVERCYIVYLVLIYSYLDEFFSFATEKNWHYTLPLSCLFLLRGAIVDFVLIHSYLD